MRMVLLVGSQLKTCQCFMPSSSMKTTKCTKNITSEYGCLHSDWNPAFAYFSSNSVQANCLHWYWGKYIHIRGQWQIRLWLRQFSLIWWYDNYWYKADSRFAPSQWEMALLCNNVSQWPGTNLESALLISIIIYLLETGLDKQINWLL